MAKIGQRSSAVSNCALAFIQNESISSHLIKPREFNTKARLKPAFPKGSPYHYLTWKSLCILHTTQFSFQYKSSMLLMFGILQFVMIGHNIVNRVMKSVCISFETFLEINIQYTFEIL